MFFIPLNGGSEKSGGGRDAIAYRDELKLSAYQHSGRFLADELAHFDNRGLTSGDQFKYSILKGGELGKRGNEALPQAEFAALTEKVTNHLRDYATRIFAGELAVSPYRLGQKTACDYCDFRPVCRFDPWTQPFRQLRPPPKPPKSDAAKKPKGKTK